MDKLRDHMRQVFPDPDPAQIARIARAMGASCEGLNWLESYQGSDLIGDAKDASLLWFARPFLVGADLRREYLSAGIDGADLRAADLRGAVMLKANLSGTNLSAADLRGANLDGADMDGAALSAAQYDEATTLPAGFDPVAAGMIKVD